MQPLQAQKFYTAVRKCWLAFELLAHLQDEAWEEAQTDKGRIGKATHHKSTFSKQRIAFIGFSGSGDCEEFVSSFLLNSLWSPNGSSGSGSGSGSGSSSSSSSSTSGSSCSSSSSGGSPRGETKQCKHSKESISLCEAQPLADVGGLELLGYSGKPESLDGICHPWSRAVLKHCMSRTSVPWIHVD